MGILVMSQPPAKKSASSTTVTQEDQDKINRFARLNTKHVDLSSEVTDYERQLENFKEAATSIEELELTSDDTTVPYRVGDVFFNFSFADAGTRLETDKTELEGQKAKALEDKAKLEDEMSKLKAELYSKFGDQINLDPETE